MTSFLVKFVSSFQNAIILNRNYFYANYSFLIYKILKLFLSRGYIYGFTLMSQNTIIKIYLKYIENKSLIKSLKVLSTLAKKKNYVHGKFFKKTSNNFLVFFLLTTNEGLFFSNDVYVTKKNKGGELLLKIQLIS